MQAKPEMPLTEHEARDRTRRFLEALGQLMDLHGIDAAIVTAGVRYDPQPAGSEFLTTSSQAGSPALTITLLQDQARKTPAMIAEACAQIAKSKRT